MPHLIDKHRLLLSTMDEDADALAREYDLGLELADFTYAPMMEDPDRVKTAERKMEGIHTFLFHGPFAELCPCAIDPRVRQVSMDRVIQAAELAEKLGICRILFHGGFIPLVYFPEWYVEQSVTFWKEALGRIPRGMTVVLENVMEPGPETLVQIAEGVNDPRLGLCLDVGHANTIISKTPPISWVEPMAPYLRHVHLHNNEGNMDTHSALGQGAIPMEAVLDRILGRCPEATFTIENQSCRASVEYLLEKGYL